MISELYLIGSFYSILYGFVLITHGPDSHCEFGEIISDVPIHMPNNGIGTMLNKTGMSIDHYFIPAALKISTKEKE